MDEVRTYALVQTLRDGRATLADQVLAVMLRNPFWQARFGERAQRFGREDGGYHIDYLCEALLAGSSASLERYATWLQSVLTSRGMCSRHLGDNFRLLAEAIATTGMADADLAADFLDKAEAALNYPAGAARALQKDQRALTERVMTRLIEAHPDWLASESRCRDDLHYHLSYLADSLALSNPLIYTQYAKWIGEFLASRDVPRGHLVDMLRAISSELFDSHAEANRAIEVALNEANS